VKLRTEIALGARADIGSEAEAERDDQNQGNVMTQPPTRYCDLVMKGGITSGIVYPNAVLALAKDFRFKNIGGTSAGAIASAASAAAAVGDRKQVAGISGVDPGATGFQGLRGVSGALSSAGFIASLFQPARGARSAYRMIVVLAGAASGPRKAFAAMAGVVSIAPIETLALLGFFLALGFWAAGGGGMVAALLPALVCAFLGGAIFALLRVARAARRNLLGLCSGLARPGRMPSWLVRLIPPPLRRAPKPALTEWLHEVLQSLSGKPSGDPLTFDDLWSAPRYPDEPSTEKAISLQMITTGVSHHEPRTLPFTDASFWFLREQFDLLFPKSVVDWMVEEAGAPEQVAGKDYYKLPSEGRMPVLVAMRMSLSFPLLISAVPLHEPAARDRAAKAPAAAADAANATPEEKSLTESMESLASGGDVAPPTITAFRVCWFSDGGISSNFPVHLFDAALPSWPTFAINLVYPKTDDRGRPATAGAPATPEERAAAAVSLPTGNNVGWQRTYQSIAGTFALGEMASFLFGILGTMQNWRDLLQARAPGQRDRIVQVSLDGTEGGMNLDMPQAVLDSISRKGTAAGERLYQFSFDNHYWIRWRNVASALQRHTIGIALSDRRLPKIPAYASAFATAKTGNPPPVSYRLSPAAARSAAEALLGQLITQGEEWHDLGPDLSAGAPRPLPQMHIIPTF
jgi:predicted acylesterase/phospholipase RssA